MAAGGHVALSNVVEPLSTEETGETGLSNVKDVGSDPFAYVVSEITRNIMRSIILSFYDS